MGFGNTMNNPKLLLLVGLALVVLVVAFGASVRLAVRSTQGEDVHPPAIVPDLNAPWIQAMRQRLTKKLTSQEMRLGTGSDLGCLVGDGQLQMPAGATCYFTILAANSTRRLSLQLAFGQSVRLTLAQKNALTIDDIALAAGQAAQWYDVYQNDENGRLTVTGCTNAKNDPLAICLISLQ